MIRYAVGLTIALISFSTLAGPWVIEPVNIIDLETGEVLKDRSVLIEKDRIASISAAGQALKPGIEKVDGKGGYLIPGLTEMHAHVPTSGSSDSHLQNILDLFLANGVTTIRGMLGEPAHLELRDSLDRGERDGPRLITSGPSFNGRSVSSADQGALRVGEQVAAGYDFLKIHPGLSREEFVAIADAANNAGIPFAGHVSYATGLNTALAKGQASIDHLDSYAEAMVPPDSDQYSVAPEFFGLNLGSAMNPDAAADLALQTAKAGVANVPTQSLFETTTGTQTLEELMARPGMDMLTPELAGRWRNSVSNIRSGSSASERQDFLSARRSLIAALQASGAPLLLGSDAPQIMNVPGYSTHQEMAFLVAAGLTPLQVLQSGTIATALYFGAKDSGQVKPGFRADLLLLGASPLEDINNSSLILGVVRGGKWYGRAALDTKLDRVRSEGI